LHQVRGLPRVGVALLFVVGLVLLILGADWLVRGAGALAQRLGVSPLVVGLTVVAFGTSAPELVVSGTASLNHQPGIAVGNVMGSTTANVGLIVGIGALLRPIPIHRRLVVRDHDVFLFRLLTDDVVESGDVLDSEHTKPARVDRRIGTDDRELPAALDDPHHVGDIGPNDRKPRDRAVDVHDPGEDEYDIGIVAADECVDAPESL